jgi:4-diphosphocytidyl-2-C-methyl-D-erythritol kinase
VSKAADREFAPFKLNLFLHVVGRQNNGYHLLESLFTFADHGDWISCLDPDAPLHLTVSGPFAHDVPAGPDNLVLRAARLLRADVTGHLHLEKNIPAASGLGGGSADAAATMRLLNRIWHLGYIEATLEQMAITLGADVPSCIRSQPVFAGGIGDTLSPVPASGPHWFLVCNPLVPMPTPTVFQRYRDEGRPFSEPLAGFPKPEKGWQACHNDLTGAATGIAPLLSPFLESLAALPGAQMARMSGSGASCFACFGSRDGALSAANLFRQRWPRAWSVVTSVAAPQLVHSA